MEDTALLGSGVLAASVVERVPNTESDVA